MTKTNKLALCACIFVATLCTPHAIAQKKKSSDKEAYQFTDVKKIPVTEVKDQHRSSLLPLYPLFLPRPSQAMTTLL